ncbi:hypothetical protein glysoja_048523 [Glycine soja]|uniref:Uncharacterized protein n=1 Tax=Glycine soja TaxID=3848 RepID=A0A0B2PMI4_GLYSO|nr:hypothetical protein glysoja_048523 [Glycine soja]
MPAQDKLTMKMACFSGPPDNNHNKDNNKRLVLPCYICLRHQLCRFISLFWPACHRHHGERVKWKGN